MTSHSNKKGSTDLTNEDVRRMTTKALNHAYRNGIGFFQVSHLIVSQETGRRLRCLLDARAALLGQQSVGCSGRIFLKNKPVVVLSTYIHDDILVVPYAYYRKGCPNRKKPCRNTIS